MQKEINEKIQFYWHENDPDDAFLHKLQRIINKYLHQEQPENVDPNVKKLSLKLLDNAGDLIGGAIILNRKDLIEIQLLALIETMRGKGLGESILRAIEEKARELGRKQIRTETCEVNVGFYQKFGYKMGGKLEDCPPGLNYFWLSKDLELSEIKN